MKFTVAGGKIEREDEEFFINYVEKYKKEFYIMYGQTEATARISYRPWEKVKEKKESIGIPIPGGKMWIEDEEEKLITKPYVNGEIVYSGNNVFMGYAYDLMDLELDSIAIMKFISGIEEEFSLNIMECEDFLDLIDNYEKLLKWLYDKCGDGVL